VFALERERRTPATGLPGRGLYSSTSRFNAPRAKFWWIRLRGFADLSKSFRILLIGYSIPETDC
jgi:hypothetical protein